MTDNLLQDLLRQRGDSGRFDPKEALPTRKAEAWKYTDLKRLDKFGWSVWLAEDSHGVTAIPGTALKIEGAINIVLVNGFLDRAWSWGWVAEILQGEGIRCVAWDWRGHGETERVGAGGYYHFPDYVRDLDELLPQLRHEDAAPHLVGHSMGGTVATMFAGLRSDRLRSLVLVEGLGPPAHAFDQTPHQFTAWLDGVAKQRARTKPKTPMSLDQAVGRMRVQNPALTDEQGRFLADKSTRVEGEGRVWRFDPLHRTTSPMPVS